MHKNAQLWRLLLGSDHQPTIVALDNHASVISSTHKMPSTEFHRRFVEYIEQLDASDWTMDNLEGNPRAVTKAYFDFLQSTASEVRDVP